MKLTILSVLSFIACFSCTTNEAKQTPNKIALASKEMVCGDTTFYINGRIKEICSTISGLRNGFYILLQENGDTCIYGNYVNGKPEGKWIRYGGDTVIFYKNSEKTDYSIGLPAANKQITELYYEHGKLTGKKEMLYYLEKEQIETEMIFEYGKDTLCKSRTWHENGELSGVNNSVNGLSNDTSRSWREDGTLLYEGFDKMGDMIYLKEFDASGKKVIRTRVFDSKTGKIIEK